MLIMGTLDLPDPTSGLLLQIFVWLLLQVVVIVIIAPLNDHFLLLGSTADPQILKSIKRREREQNILGSSIVSLPK